MFLNHLLSKQDAIFLLELINQCLFCKEKNDLVKLMGKLKCLILFDFALCSLAKTDSKGKIKSHEIVNISYPDEWLNIYVTQKYYQIDPIVVENFSQFKLQYWADTYRINTPPKDFLFTAEDFGLKKGYTYGARNLKGTEGSIFSLSSDYLERHDRTEVILTYLIPHLHQALSRILDPPSRKNKNFLSVRQREVLNWIKQGKSSWDISVILGISERTVKFHVGTIMQKFDVVTRTQAVAVALGQGLIDID